MHTILSLSIKSPSASNTSNHSNPVRPASHAPATEARPSCLDFASLFCNSDALLVRQSENGEPLQAQSAGQSGSKLSEGSLEQNIVHVVLRYFLTILLHVHLACDTAYRMVTHARIVCWRHVEIAKREYRGPCLCLDGVQLLDPTIPARINSGPIDTLFVHTVGRHHLIVATCSNQGF